MRATNQRDALKQLLEKVASVSAYGTQQTMFNLIIPDETVTAAHTLSQLGTDHEAIASIKDIPKKMNLTPVMFDIFSGTGSFGKVSAEELHRKL